MYQKEFTVHSVKRRICRRQKIICRHQQNICRHQHKRTERSLQYKLLLLLLLLLYNREFINVKINILKGVDNAFFRKENLSSTVENSLTLTKYLSTST